MDCSIQYAKLLHLMKCLRWNTLWCFSKCLWLICQSVYLCSKYCMTTRELTWSHFLVKNTKFFFSCFRKNHSSSTSKSCFHLYLLNIENVNGGLYFSNSNWRKVLWHWRFELVCAVQVWHPVQPQPCSAAPAHPTPITVGAHLSPQDMRRLIAVGVLVLVQKTASLWRSHLSKVSWLHDLNVWRCPSGVSSWHQWKREIWVVLFLKTVLKQVARNIVHITGIVFNIQRSNQPKGKTRIQDANSWHWSQTCEISCEKSAQLCTKYMDTKIFQQCDMAKCLTVTPWVLISCYNSLPSKAFHWTLNISDAFWLF